MNERQTKPIANETRRAEQDDFERLMNLPRIGAEDVTSVSMMFDPLISRRIQTFAKIMADGRVSIPEHLRGNYGDCLAIAMQAAAWRLNPFLVAQKTHLIHGKLGYEAQLVSAVVASLGILDGRFSYEYEGDWAKIEKPPRIAKGPRGPYPEPGWNPSDETGLAIIVFGKLRGDNKPRTHRLAMATIWPRNSTLWATAPQQQISYLATKQWVRRYAPDAILGVYTPDELQADYQQSEESIPKNGAIDEIMAKARTMEQESIDDTKVETGKITSIGIGGSDEKPGLRTEKAEPDLFGGEITADRGSQESEATTVRTAPESEANVAREPVPSEEKKAASQDADEDEWPQEINDQLVDCRGVPWDKDLYSARKTCTDAGVWRKRRGVSPSDIQRHEARYVAKTESSGKAKSEGKPEIDIEAEIAGMRAKIRTATSSYDLKELMEIVSEKDWPQETKKDLLDQAEEFRADWLIVEAEEEAEGQSA